MRCSFRSPPTILLCLLALKSFAAEYKFPGHTFTVPDGFSVEVIADTKLVERPITGAFDEEGRLYVSDSSGSNEKVQEQLEKKPHRIVRLEDTDDDGKFDKSVVFADKMMFPEGTMWRDGSLYVSAAPSIWKLTDTDGDGVADKREEWFQGKTLTGCANDLHGPYGGPDGRIYWCKGAFAEQTHPRPGRKPFVTRAAHVFRARADLSDFEPVMTGGMDNPVDVTFSRGGERFLSCTFFQQPAAGHRDGLIHIIYGGVYGKVHDVINDHQRTGDIMPVLSHLGPAAASGLTRYESSVFGTEYQDNLFTCCFNLRKVVRTVLVPDGASYRAQDSDFMVSDNVDFHPTDLFEDADGSLIVIDTGGWYKICCPTSQFAKPDVLGTMYRVRRINAPKLVDPRGRKINWKQTSTRELGELLGESRVAVRDRAISELAKKGSESVPVLQNIISQSDSADARLNAVWSLTRIETSEAREAVRSALQDRHETVRQAAVHSVSLHRDKDALSRLIAILKSDSQSMRRAAAEALGRIGDKQAIAPLLAAASVQQSRILEHSLIYALIEIGDPAGTAIGLSSGNSATKRAALIAIDQMEGGVLQARDVVPVLTSEDPILKSTAAWLVQYHPEWSAQLSGLFREKLSNGKLSEREREEIQKQLSELARDATMQTLMADILGHDATDDSIRVLVLKAMAQARLKETPPSWANALANCLRRAEKEIQAAAVIAIRTLPPPKEKNADYPGALVSLARNETTNTELRLDALAAIPGSIRNMEPGIFQFLLAQLDASQPALQRSATAGILGRSQLNEEQLLKLTDIVKGVGPMEVSKLLGAFQHLTNENIGFKLIAALKESKGLSGVRVDAWTSLLAKYPPLVQKEGQELVKVLNADWEKQKARLDEIQTSLPAGDFLRGQTVFHSQKVGCILCHAVGYGGGKTGPDLTRIGQIRTERDLLEAVVYPSASFVRSYEPMRVITKDGEDYSGIIKDETAESIHLVSSPTSEQHVPRSNIAEIRPGSLSIMPEGLDQQLTQQELADLIAYMKSLGTK